MSQIKVLLATRASVNISFNEGAHEQRLAGGRGVGVGECIQRDVHLTARALRACVVAAAVVVVVSSWKDA